jgi:hypothetical protein
MGTGLHPLLGTLDSLLERCCHVLSLPKPFERDIRNLRRWTQGTRSVSRRELRYLEIEDDLMNLTGSPDTAITFSESLMEDCICWLDESLGRVGGQRIFMKGGHTHKLAGLISDIFHSFFHPCGKDDTGSQTTKTSSFSGQNSDR